MPLPSVGDALLFLGLCAGVVVAAGAAVHLLVRRYALACGICAALSPRVCIWLHAAEFRLHGRDLVT